MQEFTDKVAVITGGASGIGLGIARSLAREGARIVLADVDGARAEQALSSLPEGAKGGAPDARAIATDVRDPESVARLFDTTRSAFGGVDLVFNNAGVYLGGPMGDCTFDDWRFVLDVNLDGVFHVGQRAAAMLREQGRGGVVVNTASIGGLLSHAEGLAYGVSKSGVIAYSEAMRADLGADGIQVATLCPGPIDTDLPASDRLRGARERSGGVSEALAPLVRGGMAPDEIGPIVLSGIRRDLPYIFTHIELREAFKARFDAILDALDRLGEPEPS